MLLLKSEIDKKPWHIRNLISNLDKCLLNPDIWLIHLMFKNLTGRKIHPLRLLAIINVLKVLVYFTDFRTGYIGKYNPKTQEFVHMSIKSIAYHAGLNLRRTKRVLRDLGLTMYFESKKRVERLSELIYKSFNSIKKLADKFFYHLGMKPETLRKIRRFKENEHKLKTINIDFHIDEANFIRRRVFDNSPKNNTKTFTEKIPRNMIDIMRKKFSL